MKESGSKGRFKITVRSMSFLMSMLTVTVMFACIAAVPLVVKYAKSDKGYVSTVERLLPRKAQLKTELIRLDRDGAVATLSLNRPDKRNALNVEIWRGLAEQLKILAADGDLRCVILQGQGGHFAAGADMAEFAALRATPDGARVYGEMMLDNLWGLRDLPMPTIARIEGNCLGGGLELAAMCDLRIAADDAKFGIPIQRVGITMPYPELAALVDLIGRPAMLEMPLAGRWRTTSVSP